MSKPFEMEENSVFISILKTMLDRGPGKRQVKPAAHGMLIDFAALGDSDEDDDYTLPAAKAEDSSNEDSGSANENEEESESGNESDEDESEAGDGDDVSMGDNTPSLTIGDLMDMSREQKPDAPLSVMSEHTLDTVSGVSGAENKPVRFIVCAVCLEDYSVHHDEMVECDGCGVAVHEACYGISDSVSVASTESSASTEPWFCDACKANVKPSCELCPNMGGIFKETDAGRWVHLVCALYVPGVAFGNVDQLTECTLFEMPYSRYGAKECSLCEDPRFSRTGVCVSCDAGMCRLHFHVTCAQREGLLTETSADVEIADPFFAHCKQHADKNAAKIRRRNYLAMQSQMKAFGVSRGVVPEAERDRIERKLNRHRRKYSNVKENRPPGWVPETKMPRPLTTSASAMRRLLKKAELLGVTGQLQEAESQTDVRRKHHMPLAFSPDYVRYYLDRNERIEECRKQTLQLRNQKRHLGVQEAKLRAQYDELSRSVDALKSHYRKLLESGNALWSAVCAYSKKKLTTPFYLVPATPVTEEKERKKSTNTKQTLIHKCGECEGSNDQHLLAPCDSCEKHYHLACLDPPLTRMPKKTKLYGWQCSACMKGSSSESHVSIDVTAPMRLRTNITQPTKFRVQTLETTEKKKKRKFKKGKSKSTTPKKSQTAASTPEKQDDNQSGGKKARLTTTPKKANVDPPVFNCCSVCSRESLPSQLVRCDECAKCYHFVCLNPPRKTTPRLRGYTWQCEQCNEQAASSSESE